MRPRQGTRGIRSGDGGRPEFEAKNISLSGLNAPGARVDAGDREPPAGVGRSGLRLPAPCDRPRSGLIPSGPRRRGIRPPSNAPGYSGRGKATGMPSPCVPAYRPAGRERLKPTRLRIANEGTTCRCPAPATPDAARSFRKGPLVQSHSFHSGNSNSSLVKLLGIQIYSICPFDRVERDMHGSKKSIQEIHGYP